MKKVLAILLVMASVMVSCEKDDSKPKEPKESKVFLNQDYLDLGKPERLIISDEYTEIGSEAFFECYSLKEVTIPNSVKTIGFGSFACSGLKEVTIGNGVTIIGDAAFYGCDDLKEVTIPHSVTSIGDEAFYGCDDLKEVTIGNSVTSIGDSAFLYCYNLTSINVPSDCPIKDDLIKEYGDLVKVK